MFNLFFKIIKIIKYLLLIAAILPILIYIYMQGNFNLPGWYIFYIFSYWIVFFFRLAIKYENNQNTQEFNNRNNNYNNYNNYYLSKKDKQKQINGGLTDNDVKKQKEIIRKKIIDCEQCQNQVLI